MLTSGLGFLLVAGSSLSSAQEAPGRATSASSIPNMTCTPFARVQREMPPSQWNECVGMYTYQDGNVYSGEFRHGDRAGLGILHIEFIGKSGPGIIGWDEPAIYVGSFRKGRLNGFGLLIARSGAAYAGMFKDNIAQFEPTHEECSRELSASDWTNCIGTYRFPNGNVYRGQLSHGLPEGIGMLQVNALGTPEAAQVRLPLPGVYVGQFKKGKLSGKGAVVMSGDGYFGKFKDNRLFSWVRDR
jgi:hypothetical protein